MTFQISRIHPPVSYYIPGGVKEGKQFIIRGRATEEWFQIRLQEGPQEGCDVAFLFNSRPEISTVVRNTYRGEWEEEERETPDFPFLPGVSFLIRIEVTVNEYRVYVNGRFYIDFVHRMRYDKVHFIYLSGGTEYYDLTCQDKYALPYLIELQDGMADGKAVRVRGACTDSDGFSVNFAGDPECNECAFHFNPRPNQGTVVRNDHYGGWGEEERDIEEFPFNPGQYFDATFIATSNCYLVYLNDKYFTTFNHRASIGDAKYLVLKGDVSIADVQYYEPMDDDFVKKIPSGLMKGDIVLFRGYLKKDANGFAVYLMNGYDTESDVAFVFNPRRNEAEVVMNNRIDGQWLEEERKEIPIAFVDSLPFELKIVTKNEKFKVYVNGTKYCSFRARAAVEDIRGINVRGEAHIYQAKLLRKLDLPYYEHLPGGVRPGSWIIVQGTPKKSKERFEINLRSDASEGSEIALHFNPRLNDSVTVRNSFEGGAWQMEERHQPNFPFEKKDTFEIAINVQSDRFIIYVNGEHYVDFNHRVPIENIRFLHLTGCADFFEPEFY